MFSFSTPEQNEWLYRVWIKTEQLTEVWTPKKLNKTRLSCHWDWIIKSIGDQKSSWIMNLEEKFCSNHESLRQKRQELEYQDSNDSASTPERSPNPRPALQKVSRQLWLIIELNLILRLVVKDYLRGAVFVLSRQLSKYLHFITSVQFKFFKFLYFHIFPPSRTTSVDNLHDLVLYVLIISSEKIFVYFSGIIVPW